MYRMRRLPAPLSVMRPPPSITISGPVSLKIFAVSSNVIVNGSGPQSKVMMPPCATACTTASPLQLAGEPSPMTLVGLDTSASPASDGTSHVASALGLPAGGPSSGLVSGLGTITLPPLPEPGPTLTPEEPPLDEPEEPSLSPHPTATVSIENIKQAVRFMCVYKPPKGVVAPEKDGIRASMACASASNTLSYATPEASMSRPGLSAPAPPPATMFVRF